MASTAARLPAGRSAGSAEAAGGSPVIPRASLLLLIPVATSPDTRAATTPVVQELAVVQRSRSVVAIRGSLPGTRST